MKTILSYLTIQLCWLSAFSQLPDNLSSAWISGDNTINNTGVYGPEGQAGLNFKPGARDFSETWRDNSGNLWLYGGYGYADADQGMLSDLWKYDPYSNEWTFVKGNTIPDQQGVYGNKGVSSATTHPGTIYFGSSWTDNSGNLWLFGGYGHADGSMGFLNTLWKFEPSKSQWTWVKGDSTVDQVGEYGPAGHAADRNNPGARYGSQTWKDSTGNLWLFGGYGFDANGQGLLSDLWKFDPTTNKWTWVSGDKVIDQTGHYGTQGIPTGTNLPGGRYSGHTWTDLSGNLWLMGGYGLDEADNGILDDLWKYNPATNEWTWVKGDKTINQFAHYGTKNIHSALNKPGGRYMGISWTDMYGDLWIFGGFGFNDQSAGYLNDLWKFHPATNEWTWVKGDSTLDEVSVYGVQGMPDPDNKTGSRTGSLAWSDGGGNLWLFGGFGYDGSAAGTLNDLWSINNMQIPLALQLLQFNGALRGEAAQLNWKSTKETGICHYTVQRSFDGTHFNNAGELNGKGAAGINDYIFTDYTLKNVNTNRVFYRLEITQSGSATTYSKVIRFDIGAVNIGIQLYPNPAMTNITLSYQLPVAGPAAVSIMDARGVTVISKTTNQPAGMISEAVDISRLSSGTYFVIIRAGNTLLQKTFVRQ